jgi:hypothetical protein
MSRTNDVFGENSGNFFSRTGSMTWMPYRPRQMHFITPALEFMPILDRMVENRHVSARCGPIGRQC